MCAIKNTTVVGIQTLRGRERVVHFYLFITLLVTVGTLHSLLCIRIVVDQELQQAVLRWKGAVPLQHGYVTVGKTHIQAD